MIFDPIDCISIYNEGLLLFLPIYILCTLRLCSMYSSWELKVMNAHASHTYLSSGFSDIFFICQYSIYGTIIITKKDYSVIVIIISRVMIIFNKLNVLIHLRCIVHHSIHLYNPAYNLGYCCFSALDFLHGRNENLLGPPHNH